MAADFKHIWVFCEQRQGVLSPAALELISEGRRLADELGVEVCGLLLGDQVDGLARELGGYGADKVYIYNSPLLKDYTTDAYTKVVVDAAEALHPDILLFPASDLGRDLAPRCAARLQTGLCADCTHLDIGLEGYKSFLRANSALDVDSTDFASDRFDVGANLKMTMPAFGGHLMATIVCPDFRPVMATVRPGVMEKRPYDGAKAAAVTLLHPDFTLAAGDIHTEVLETVKLAKTVVDLAGADFIVAVGGGISQDPARGLTLAQELADELGGVVGCSRAAVEAGWLSVDHQVGQTGKTVRPKVYIALGVSGAIQHNIGMLDSQCVIAVNNSAQAPIFEIAHYGICGDLFKVVPEMIASLRAAREKQ